MKLNRTAFALVLGAVLAVGLAGSAWAALIVDISDPMQYGSQNTYFAYAEIVGPSNDWDGTKASVEGLPDYNGLSAHLAVFQTDEVYTWMVANYSKFSGPKPGSWD